MKIPLGSWRYERRRREATADGHGHITRHDGYENVELEAVIDVEKLTRHLALKAMDSRKGRTAIGGGAVVVRVVSRKPAP